MAIRAGRKWSKLWLLGLGGLLLGACAGSEKPLAGAPVPPAWLDALPASKEELCATGVSGPTYYQEDAIASSKANAFTQLARAVQVKVTSQMTVRETADGTGRSEVSVEELSAFMSDAVLKLAQVRSEWVNPGGYPARGEKGSVYTLVCMPLNLSTAELDGKVRGQIPVANPRLPLLLERTEEVMREWAQ